MREQAGSSAGVPQVVTLGLACCGLEARPGALALRSQALAALPGSPASVLVVAGTVTGRLATRIRETYQGLPQPVVVVAFGACAISGGPYWDSYSVLPGLGELIEVDAVVPGCPPRPDDVAAAIVAACRG